MLRTIRDIDIDGKRVFIRCDFNVPKDDDGNITDDRRIRSALQTIRYCIQRDCKIILASHYERPIAGVYDKKFSLAPVARRLYEFLGKKLLNSKDVIGQDTMEKYKRLKEGRVLLLENLRFEKGETTNDKEFAKKLASLADIYINDAFGASHRKHASIHALALEFDENSKAAGFLLKKEVNFFSRIVKKPARPFVAVIGGSKVSGKLQTLIHLIENVDKIIIGGGMAFTFLKAVGYEVGNSLIENDLLDEARKIMKKAKEKNVKFYLPVDVVIAQRITDDAITKHVPVQEIPKDWMGLDIGPASSRLFKEVLDDVQIVLWNGPMGVYESEKFQRGSFDIARYIAEGHSISIVGGGDTADVVQKSSYIDEMTFVSTGGGASLELLEGKILPGIEVLSKNK